MFVKNYLGLLGAHAPCPCLGSAPDSEVPYVIIIVVVIITDYGGIKSEDYKTTHKKTKKTPDTAIENCHVQAKYQLRSSFERTELS